MIAGWDVARAPAREVTNRLKPTISMMRFFDSAIIDCSDIIDCMASITIRQLPEATKRKLKIRAAEHGRSMEREAREILQAELAKTAEEPKNIVKAIRGIFEPLGGVELEIPPREPIRDPGVR